DVHRPFVDAGPLHVAADAVQLRSAVFLRPERRVPLGAFRDDERHIAERLDVVHRRRLVVETDYRGKRRLVTRLGAFAFERLEQRGFFAGLIRAGTAMHEDVAVEPGAEDVFPQEPTRIGLVDRAFEDLLRVQELSSYI